MSGTVKLLRLGSGAGFKIVDKHGRALAYVYGVHSPSTAQSADLTYAEAEAVAKILARALKDALDP